MFISIDSDSLDDASEVSKWLISQVEGDHIEDITDEMLDKLVSGDHPGVSSTFCKCRWFYSNFCPGLLYFILTYKY